MKGKRGFQRIIREPKDCSCESHAFAPTNAWGIVLVDVTDRHLLDDYSWSLTSNHYPPMRGVAYAQSDICKRILGSRYLHHAVRGVIERTDHENGNGLDNRKTNLRPASHKDNIRNARKSRRNVTGFKGVHIDPRQPGKPFVAVITVDRKAHYLGAFSASDDAARAYDDAAKRFFGTFARLNFPPNGG